MTASMPRARKVRQEAAIICSMSWISTSSAGWKRARCAWLTRSSAAASSLPIKVWRAVRPWTMALRQARALPAAVMGPRDFAPLMRDCSARVFSRVVRFPCGFLPSRVHGNGGGGGAGCGWWRQVIEGEGKIKWEWVVIGRISSRRFRGFPVQPVQAAST